MTVGAGLDPSIGSLGLGVTLRTARGYELVWAKTIRTNAGDCIELRLNKISDALAEVLIREKPSFLAIEDQRGVQAGKYLEGEFQSNNSKTLLVQGLAHGVARCFRVPVILLQPQQVKLAVLGPGHRSATKKQVQDAILRLTGKKVPQDAADGSAISVGGHQRWASAPAWRSA